MKDQARRQSGEGHCDLNGLQAAEGHPPQFPPSVARLDTVSVPLRGLDVAESRAIAEAWCARAGHHVAGIQTARDEGFRVRVAATLSAHDRRGLTAFHDFLEGLGIPREDQLVRTVAHRGVADSGLELTLDTLVPEVTVTADGVYWHPVGADHEDQLVTRTLFPLAGAIAEVRRRFVEIRTNTTSAAQYFPCA